MLNFDDPAADAGEAAAALRSLAHTNRVFDNPADTYPVIGELLTGVRSLGQVLDQLATAHTRHQAVAHDDTGNQTNGADTAQAAASQLRQARTLLDQVEERLDAASQLSGQIAWHPVQTTPARRWISVVFLGGDAAQPVLHLIRRRGVNAAIAKLAEHDRGEDTLREALVNGYVYDTPPRGAVDRIAADGCYTLLYSPFLGHVNLLREHDTTPDPTRHAEQAPTIDGRDRSARPAAPAEPRNWFAPPRPAPRAPGPTL